MPFDDLPGRTVGSLRELIDAVDGTVPFQRNNWDFQVPAYAENADAPPVITEVRDWADSNYYLYFFELVAEADPITVSTAFSLAKAQGRDGRSYSRLNDPSNILYVGGSASIATRLRQHLGFGARRTYSLHFAHWAPVLDLHIRFCCAGYRGADMGEVYQCLEDQLWDDFAPMFGRRGRR